MSINHFILLNKSLSNKIFDITIVKDPFIEAPIAQTVERMHSGCTCLQLHYPKFHYAPCTYVSRFYSCTAAIHIGVGIGDLCYRDIRSPALS